MAEWLVVAGTSVLIMATVGLVRQAASRGQSVLLFMLPLAGVRQVQEHWEAYGLLALLRVLGFVIALAGLGLLYIRHEVGVEAPEQVLHGAKTTSTTSFVGSQQAALLMVQGEGKALVGRVHGESLAGHPRVSLIHGVLSIDEGRGFLPDLSVSILLGWDGDAIKERRTLLITPADRSGPDVHLSWRPQGHSYPETRIFHEGYRLELALAPLDRHQLTGTLQLVMPDSLDSYLVGDFTAHTNDLRFLADGKVDLAFDDPDTLGYVSEQYLQTQYPEGAIDHVKIENVNLHRDAGEGEVQARVTLHDGTVERRHMNLQKTTVGWAVAPGPAHSEVLKTGTADHGAAASGEHSGDDDGTAPASARRLGTFDDLNGYIGHDVTLVDKDGERTVGRLQSIADGRLRLRISVGAGHADIRRAGADLSRVILDDGTVLTWGPAADAVSDGPDQTGASTGSPLAPDTSNTASAGESDSVSSEQAAVGDASPEGPWRRLIGHKVVVRLHNGDTHTGLLRGIQPDHVTLAVSLGSGTLEYTFELRDIVAIDAASGPDAEP